MVFFAAGLAKEFALTDQDWNLTTLSGATLRPGPGKTLELPFRRLLLGKFVNRTCMVICVLQ